MASCAELAARQPSFAAERSECEGRDWRNLIAVVKRAMPVIKTAIEEVGRERQCVIYRLGLLARYDQLDLFNWVRARTMCQWSWCAVRPRAIVGCSKPEQTIELNFLHDFIPSEGAL